MQARLICLSGGTDIACDGTVACHPGRGRAVQCDRRGESSTVVEAARSRDVVVVSGRPGVLVLVCLGSAGTGCVVLGVQCSVVMLHSTAV
eukprot:393178-Rhodomonas_salina.3